MVDVKPDGHRALVRAVRTSLAAQADPVRAAAQRAYMRSALPYYGVTLPAVRASIGAVIAAQLPGDRDSWQAAIRALWDGATHREEWYAALVLARFRRCRQWATDLDSLPLWEHLIRTGAWWDVGDEITEHLIAPLLVAHPAAVTATLRSWSTDPDLWIRRAVILAQNRRRADTDLDLLAYCLAGSLSDTNFFARKAVGWALREYSKTDPRWVAAYVSTHGDRLSGLTRREALRLIR